MAAASVFVMELDKAIYDQETQAMQGHLNVGSGSDITISELAQTVANVVGYQGKIVYDHTKPDGSPRKWMDSARLNRLGWQAQVTLESGLHKAYLDMQAFSNITP